MLPKKFERPRFRGWTVCGILQKMIRFLETVSITVRKISFLEYFIFKKSVKNCPRDVKTALGISDDGEG